MKIDTREYAVEVRRLPDEEGGGWLAEVMDLPGCVSDGETVAEAFENAQGAIASWIEAAEEAGRPVPAPSTMVHYSGKWLMRVPKSLHRRLAEQARHEGVSLNALASAILAEGLGYRTRGKTGRQRNVGTAGKRADTYEAELLSHSRVYRPWGYYQDIDAGDHFRVKRITVNPGAKLSLQKHRHRAEHWVVVSGTARVTRGDETFLLHENESTYISLGVVHRLENPGPEPLQIIEVQSDRYLGEDDIVRLEDTYGRT